MGGMLRLFGPSDNGLDDVDEDAYPKQGKEYIDDDLAGGGFWRCRLLRSSEGDFFFRQGR